MGWFSKATKKKPKCEREFEKEYEEAQEKMSHRILYREERHGIVFQDYFPAQNGWVKPYLLEEQLGIAILQRWQCLVEQQPLE